MVIPSLSPYRKRPRPVRQKPPTAPAALNLTAASFDPDGPEVYLTFDRPINISGLVVGQFAIVDGPDGNGFTGSGVPTLVSPTEVQVLMGFTGPVTGADVLLTAGSANGIIATDDGGHWPGVGGAGLVLPFG